MSKRKSESAKILAELSPPKWTPRPAETKNICCHIAVKDTAGDLVKQADIQRRVQVVQFRTSRGAVVSELTGFDYGGTIRNCHYAWAQGAVTTKCLRSTRGEWYAKFPTDRSPKELWLRFLVQRSAPVESTSTHVVVSGTRTKELPNSASPPACATEEDSDADKDAEQVSPCRPTKKARLMPKQNKKKEVRASHTQLGRVKSPPPPLPTLSSSSETESDDEPDMKLPLTEWIVKRKRDSAVPSHTEESFTNVSPASPQLSPPTSSITASASSATEAAAATLLKIAISPLSPPAQVTASVVPLQLLPPQPAAQITSASAAPEASSAVSSDDILSLMRRIEEQEQKKRNAEAERKAHEEEMQNRKNALSAKLAEVTKAAEFAIQQAELAKNAIVQQRSLLASFGLK